MSDFGSYDQSTIKFLVTLLLIFLSIIMSITVYNGFRLVFGTLYPAYASYKAVKTKNVKEYVS